MCECMYVYVCVCVARTCEYVVFVLMCDLQVIIAYITQMTVTPHQSCEQLQDLAEVFS